MLERKSKASCKYLSLAVILILVCCYAAYVDSSHHPFRDLSTEDILRVEVFSGPQYRRLSMIQISEEETAALVEMLQGVSLYFEEDYGEFNYQNTMFLITTRDGQKIRISVCPSIYSIFILDNVGYRMDDSLCCEIDDFYQACANARWRKNT